MSEYEPLYVRVWGEFACFTRPEMKVERVTYSVMTPSAARGVLEAIFWKPEFQWIVQEVEVLRPISYFSLVRNEVASRASLSAGRARVAEGRSYFAEEDRSQRNTLALRDVAYGIRADVRLRAGVGENPVKYRDQFRRRVSRGQCWHQPYLGCREFSAYFGERQASERPIERTEALGRILFDLEYAPDEAARPVFFDAQLERGVLRVPVSLYGGEQ